MDARLILLVCGSSFWFTVHPQVAPLSTSVPGATRTSEPSVHVVAWRYSPSGATGLTSGDVDGDGAAEVVLCRGKEALVLTGDGQLRRRFPLRDEFLWVQCAGRLGSLPALLLFGGGAEGIAVYRPDGTFLWRYHSGSRDASSRVARSACAVPTAIGTPRLIAVGFDNAGGLHVVDSSGKRRWSRLDIRVVGPVVGVRLGNSSLIAAKHAGKGVATYDLSGKRGMELNPPGYVDQLHATDTNGDGEDEIITVSREPMYHRHHDWSVEVSVYGTDGKAKWRRGLAGIVGKSPQRLTSGVFAAGRRQLAVAIADRRILLLDADGSPLHLEPIPLERTLSALHRVPGREGAPDDLLVLTDRECMRLSLQAK
jgi:hypothetical protein